MANTSREIHIVWFRLDLRTHDNPALHEAAKNGAAVVPVLIWQPDEAAPWEPGAASRWWLHLSLNSLAATLGDLGAPLIIRSGPSLETLLTLIEETGATAIYWNRVYEPSLIKRDSKIKEVLKGRGIEVHSFNSSLLKEPWEIQNSQRKPFQVFTPFWKKLSSEFECPNPLAAPKKLRALSKKIRGLPVNELKLLPSIPWDKEFYEHWKPGEDGAAKALKKFTKNALRTYASDRDCPSLSATSRLAAYLHFGEIGPRQIWFEIEKACGDRTRDAEPFLRQLGWRDFAHHLLFHFPQTPTKPLRPAFEQFPWKKNKKLFTAWQKGLTGYPIVDAGMRELWRTGTMHNRVRMIVASFLVKDLLQPWQDGARWFWDTLVDADLANNTLGWQWTAGCGADAAPYFRVFNPTLQGEKFDLNGNYVRRWVPELSKLSNKWVHKPWECPAPLLEKARIELGKTYPSPIVDHSEARDIALEAYEELSSKRQTTS